jgi:hypothetical protein
MKLELLRTDSSGLEIAHPTTLFLQYKHNTSMLASHTKVSEMNKVAEELAAALLTMEEWDTLRNWLILWISNKAIEVDADPHPNLLWVGRNELEKHAPLIGRRGLVLENRRVTDRSQAKAKGKTVKWREGKSRKKRRNKIKGLKAKSAMYGMKLLHSKTKNRNGFYNLTHLVSTSTGIMVPLDCC